MTPQAIQQAAERNRAHRLGQIKRLHRFETEAREKREALQGAKAGAANALQSIAAMRELKYVPGFFPTPRAVIAELQIYADVRTGHRLLEPSAGKGDIMRAFPDAIITAYEINYRLAKLSGATCVDFMDVKPAPEFDRVVMNPPFENRADWKHVLHAYEFLKPGGRLVSVVTSTTAARLVDWGEIVSLPDKAFATSERPTGVRTALVIKDKPAV